MCRRGPRPGAVFRRSARGYAFDGKTPVEYPTHFVTAAGLVSTVGDVLRFSMGLDHGQLLQPATKELAFTPARSSRGKGAPLCFRLVRTESTGVKVVWHYGWDPATPGLSSKCPEREVTFVLLGNSEALSRKFDLGQDEDVTRSPFDREFLRTMDCEVRWHPRQGRRPYATCRSTASCRSHRSSWFQLVKMRLTNLRS